MSVSSRRNKKTNRQSAAAAAAAAAVQRKKRRRVIATVAAGIAILLIVASAVSLLPSNDTKAVASTTTIGTVDTTSVSSSPPTGAPPTTVPALASAKDKPCVAVKGALPQGAPAVPVKIGPPPTSLIKEDLKAGTGAVVAASQTVTVNYIGVACSTGEVFDSSWSRGEPATFPLTGVIKGWTDGIPGMRVGGRRLLGIPSDQAYGPSGQGSAIAPDEALWFVVDVTAAS